MASFICYFVFLYFLKSSVLHAQVFPAQRSIQVVKDKEQVYDCVEFYKQRAFNHSSVKNLTYQIKPSLTSVEVQENSILGLKDEGCPLGTVPILRYSTIEPHAWPMQKRCKATVRTRANDPNKKFTGIAGAISVYRQKDKPTQWSTARIKLINGPDSIEAGFMVNKGFFKDDEGHLYGAFTAGSKGCINTQCPGFVQVSKDIPLGAIPRVYSTITGDKKVGTLRIAKNPAGDWVLYWGPGKTIVGYWPNSLFTKLKGVANQVEWGGEVGNPKMEDPAPEMGSGLKARYDTTKSACIANATVLNKNFAEELPADTEKYMECHEFYTTLDGGYQGLEWGRIMFFGGPN